MMSTTEPPQPVFCIVEFVPVLPHYSARPDAPTRR
jgi:hypothetical protein